MQIKTIKIAGDRKPIEIYCIGDIHEGAANVNETAFKKAIKIIRDSGAYWLGMGDYIDAINHKDPRFNPHEICHKYGITDLDDLPNRQIEYIVDMLMPIANNCVGLLAGNHEDSFKRHNGFDPMNRLAKALGTENLRQKAYIAFEYERRMTFTICAVHGTGGGGMREGYPINKTYDTFRWDVADFNVQGHGHKLVTDRSEFTMYHSGKILKRAAFYGMTGCFLNKSVVGTDGYFENRPGKESDIGMLKIGIKPGKDLKIDSLLSLDKIYI